MSRPSSLFSHAVLGLAATTLLTTGCYKVGYKTGLPAGGGSHDVTIRHFLWGAAGGGDQDLAAQCPNGVSSVQEQKSFVDQLISGLTGFLYSPTSVVVECAAGGATASNP